MQGLLYNTTVACELTAGNLCRCEHTAVALISGPVLTDGWLVTTDGPDGQLLAKYRKIHLSKVQVGADNTSEASVLTAISQAMLPSLEMSGVLPDRLVICRRVVSPPALQSRAAARNSKSVWRAASICGSQSLRGLMHAGGKSPVTSCSTPRHSSRRQGSIIGS